MILRQGSYRSAAIALDCRAFHGIGPTEGLDPAVSRLLVNPAMLLDVEHLVTPASRDHAWEDCGKRPGRACYAVLNGVTRRPVWSPRR